MHGGKAYVKNICIEKASNPSQKPFLKRIVRIMFITLFRFLFGRNEKQASHLGCPSPSLPAGRYFFFPLLKKIRPWPVKMIYASYMRELFFGPFRAPCLSCSDKWAPWKSLNKWLSKLYYFPFILQFLYLSTRQTPKKNILWVEWKISSVAEDRVAGFKWLVGRCCRQIKLDNVNIEYIYGRLVLSFMIFTWAVAKKDTADRATAIGKMLRIWVKVVWFNIQKQSRLWIDWFGRQSWMNAKSYLHSAVN